jgi:hypothetical protein
MSSGTQRPYRDEAAGRINRQVTFLYLIGD